MANLITLVRTIVLFGVVALIYTLDPWVEFAAFWLTVLVLWADVLDGYVARRRGSVNALGAVVDIAGDRVVENVFWVVFAHLNLIPVWIPLAIIVRSFFIDGLRSLALTEGQTPFGDKTMMRSPIGRWLVSSRFSRGFYGIAKCVVFCFLILVLMLRVGKEPPFDTLAPQVLPWFEPLVLGLTYFAVLFCLVRGVMVVWDSRKRIFR